MNMTFDNIHSYVVDVFVDFFVVIDSFYVVVVMLFVVILYYYYYHNWFGGSQNIKVVTNEIWSLGRVELGNHISQLKFSIESTSETQSALKVSGVNQI